MMLHVKRKSNSDSVTIPLMKNQFQYSIQPGVVLKKIVDEVVKDNLLMDDGQIIKWFVDEDKDMVLLDNFDAYHKAYKWFIRSRNGLEVVVDTHKKDKMLYSSLTRCSQNSKSASESSFPVTEMSLPEEPPIWLESLMNKMRKELRQDMLDMFSFTKNSTSSSKCSSTSRACTGSDILNAKLDCDLCSLRMFGPRYFCLLKNCETVLCSACFCLVGHCENHTILRVHPNYEDETKSLLVQTEHVLDSIQNLKAEDRTSVKSMMIEDEEGRLVIGETHIFESENDCSSAVKNAEVDASATSPEFNAVIDGESEACLMNDLGAGKAIYWKQWTVRNSGVATWRNIKARVVQLSSDKLAPFDPVPTITTLKPNQSTDLVVLMYGPIGEEGEYEAQWKFHTPQMDNPFGPVLQFNINIHSPDFYPDETSSMISTDFELVSDLASNLSFSSTEKQNTPTEELNQIFEVVSNEELNGLENLIDEEGDNSRLKDEDNLSYAELINAGELSHDEELKDTEEFETVEINTGQVNHDEDLINTEMNTGQVNDIEQLKDADKYASTERLNRDEHQPIDQSTDENELWKSVDESTHTVDNSSIFTFFKTQLEWGVFDSEDSYSMAMLVSIGFNDIQLNMDILRQFEGSLEQTVDFLLFMNGFE